MRTPARKRKRILSPAALVEASECLRILAHPKRLMILQLLLGARYSVGQLAELCAIKPNVASEHLRLMQHCGLLDGRREGKTIFYEIVEPHVAALLTCLENRFGTQ